MENTGKDTDRSFDFGRGYWFVARYDRVASQNKKACVYDTGSAFYGGMGNTYCFFAAGEIVLLKLEYEKINEEKYYSVGYSSNLKKYILVDVVTWIAWYNRYFEITEEEYRSFGTDVLDKIADQVRKEGIVSNRFLFSDKIEENNEDQQAALMTFRNT